MALRLTEEEYAALIKRRNAGAEKAEPGDRANPPEARTDAPRRRKYGNRRVEIDGMWFDSQHEAEIYLELEARRRAGELKAVCRQVKFDLPGGIQYVADFVAIAPDMRVEGVYDAKSEITKKNRVYINKKKQMMACWGIDIREV